jgi:tight adherence protein C
VDGRPVTEWLPLAGLGAGTGAALILFGLFGARSTLSAQLARLDPIGVAGAGSSPTAPVELNRRARLGTALLAAFGRVSTHASSSAADLALVGTRAAAHAAQVATAAICGLATAPALAALAAAVGIGFPLVLPLVACVGLGTVAALSPVVRLRRQAAARRREFRHALACWLELVALGQAAGMGIESALKSASSISDDERFQRIRSAVEGARRAGRTPWAGLSQLGEELAIPDLVELGATLSLAGVEGARIRGSLAARARALRQKELTEAEAEANATTERLFLPSIVLMLGFLLFVGYPAVVTLTHTI